MTDRISIVVPSYRRPDRLARSLRALARQTRVPDEILVVCRREDAATHATVAGAPGVKRIEVAGAGVLAAMRAGAQAASGAFIGFVDDDAEARANWLEGVMCHFADGAVGGVGGRDIVAEEPDDSLAAMVGRITSAGKLVGNHHLGTGPARDVDVLKAANMVFRRSALALPDGLRGEGAQVHFEVATSLWAINAGWRLVYDPALLVDHLPAPRFDEDGRGSRSARATHNAAFNLVTCIGSVRPELRRRRLAYGLLVGDRDTPGLLRAARALAGRETRVVASLVPSMRGQIAAHVALQRGGSAFAMYRYPAPGSESVAPVPPRAVDGPAGASYGLNETMRHTYADLPPLLVSELDPARRVADVPANQFEHAAATASGALPAPSERFVGSISLDEALTLYRLVRELEPAATAEVGLAGGASCLAILQALEHNGRGEHHVCDPYQATWNDAGLHNVRESGLAARLRFSRGFPEQSVPDLPSLQFAFIDASHLFDLSVLDFVLVDKRMDVGGVIGLHDLWMPSLRKLVRFVVANRGYEIHRHDVAPALTRGDRVRFFVAGAARRIPRADALWSQEFLHPWREFAGSNATLLFLRKTRDDDRDWRFHQPF